MKVGRGIAWKRWGRGRARQVAKLARCRLVGHDWSPWTVDDMDGPGEWHDTYDGPSSTLTFMPLTSREARDDEPYAIRACRRRCGTVETRVPVA